jgi:hypothetical protein
MWGRKKSSNDAVHPGQLRVPNNILRDEHAGEVLRVWAQNGDANVVLRGSHYENLGGRNDYEKLGYMLADIGKEAVNNLRRQDKSGALADIENEQIMRKIFEACLDELCLDISNKN